MSWKALRAVSKEPSVSQMKTPFVLTIDGIAGYATAYEQVIAEQLGQGKTLAEPACRQGRGVAGGGPVTS